MKKWYRIGICLVLAICLLMLSACGSKQLSENADSTGGQLAWRYNTLDTFAGPQNAYSKESTINRMTYGAWRGMALTNQETHLRCAGIGHCELGGSSPCGVVEYFESTNYNEEFFEENTLLVITLRVDANNPTVLKDVQYANGVLTCFVELGKPIRRELTARRTLYVQIETVLPENTELKLEITSKEQTESELALQWEESYLSLSGTWKLWEKDAPKIAKVLTYESYRALMDECVSRHGVCTVSCFMYSEDDGLCPYGRAIRNVPYTKEFFDTNSLIVLGLSDGIGSTIFEVHDLTYTGGVLNCSIDVPFSREVGGNAIMASWFCFVAVDTVLPPETEVVLDLGSVEYDYETYKQKDDQFHEKCSP